MFLLLRALFLVLIIGCLFGCGTDEDNPSEIPVVTIELIQQESEEAWFRLNVAPAPTTDLAILIETEALGPFSDDYEIGYTWLIVPRFTNSREFKFSLDNSVPWDIKILSLAGRDLNVYPIEGTEVTVGFAFSQYKLGDVSSVKTENAPWAQLSVALPRSSGSLFASVPANATLTFIFDNPPRDVTVSQGDVTTRDNIVTVNGPFPFGDIAIELNWNSGRQHYTWYHTITELDFESPKIVQAQVFFNNGWVWTFQDGWGFSPDANEIRIDFNEKIWFHEQVTGVPDIQTKDGTRLGWQAKKALLKPNSISLSLSAGQPLKPQTTYIVRGIVTDLANETEIKLTFTTTK